MARDKLSHFEYINKIYDEINEMINNNKINLAKKMITEHLTRFPNSGILKHQLADCLIKEKNYEQALIILEDAPEESVFLQLVPLYIKLENEEKLFELYQKYFQNQSTKYNQSQNPNYESYQLMKLYLQRKFELNKPDINIELDAYTQNQVCNYNPRSTIDLIKANYQKDSTSKKEQYFTDEIDIEELFSKVQNYIFSNLNQGTIYKSFYERYEFYYPHCGETINGEILDAFEVFTIIGSSNILSILPVKSDKNLIIESYENLDKSTTSEKPLSKVKKPKSGLERFNQRYKTNQ